MFKKTRRKIVLSIMTTLVVLWVGTLGIIYASSYYEMKNQNEDMLKAHAEMYNLPPEIYGFHHDRPMPEPNGHGFNPAFINSPMFRLSTFYTVAISDSGETLEIINEPPTVHTDSDLENLALNILAGNKDSGKKNNLLFYKLRKVGYTLVAFMDNTVMRENASTLFRHTLIFGGAALILFFFISVFLAKKIVKPLEESYQKQKQFISDAGHELKTPVSVVNANAELLMREIGNNKWLSNIQYESERMGTLVSQLLELARTESTKPQTELIDFSRLCIGESLPFESVAFEKGLALIENISDKINVVGNSVQLKQIISILLDNAIRHGTGGKEIYLNLAEEHGFAKLSVINNGDEIPKDQRERLFERFYRADSARSGDDSHYGLGLAIAKAIAESHNGNIDVICYDGLVEFRFKIPLAQSK